MMGRRKNIMIRVTAKDNLLLISVTGICSFFSCWFLHFRAIKLWENLYHFSLKFSNTLNMTQNTKEYCVIITKSTIVQLTRNIARHLGISVTAVTDTIFTPVIICIAGFVIDQTIRAGIYLRDIMMELLHC